MESKKAAIIVGAGMSGLTAAKEAVRAGLSVTVLDKGRGVGGRMATRRIGDATFDHGAQFFTVSDPRFGAMVAEWRDAGVIAPWPIGGPTSGRKTGETHRPCYRGEGGMTAVCKLLATKLDVRTSARATAVRREADRVVVETDDGDRFVGDAAVLSSPVPQTLDLLDAGRVELSAGLEERLRGIRYRPSFAIMAVLDGPSRIPHPGGWKLPGDPISWIADNTAKGISPKASAVTIHASADYTSSRLDDDRDDVKAELLAAAEEHLGAAVVESQIHRWLYSEPVAPTTERYLVDRSGAPLLFAGDAFGGPRVEGAALSGLEAGQWVVERLGNGKTAE